jgi:putative ABC transport system permease protein
MSFNTLSPSIRVGFSALRINPLRTTLSALGVIIGVGAMVSVLSLSDGVEESVRGQLARDGRAQSIGISTITDDIVDGQRIPRAGSSTFSIDDARALARTVGDAGVVFMGTSGPGLVSGTGKPAATRRAALISATLANGAERRGIEVEAGRFFNDDEVTRARRVIVISRQLADAVLGQAVTSAAAVGRDIRLQDSMFQVIGVWTPAPDPGQAGRNQLLAYVPITTAEHAMTTGSRPATAGFTLKAAKIEDMPVLQARAESWLGRRFGDWKKDVSIASYAEESAKIRDNMVLFKLLMSAITGISLVVGGVGIMNVLLASVTERTREIGVRKATGARNKDLLAQFLAESVAIAGLGSVLGTALGIAVAAGVAALMRARTMAQVHAGFSASTLMVAIIAPIVVGIAFGIYPALRAARLSPIDAIRHE